MGIGGSGFASSIAEGIAFVVFAIYILADKKNRSLQLFSGLNWDWELARQQFKLSMSVVAQAAVGQGSWIFFFGMVENLGERALAISNLARTVYLMLSIPLWGFASGANTLISNLIGQKRYRDVLTANWRAGFLCWGVTMAIALPVLLQPTIFLYPLLGAQDSSLMQDARPVFLLMLGLLSLSTFGMVSFNALAGAGATWFGLKIQTSSVVLYLSYIYYVTNFTSLGVVWVWVGEILYWVLMLSWMVWYLRSFRWRRLKL
jgi:Na+-driven multidrug efflux pump